MLSDANAPALAPELETVVVERESAPSAEPPARSAKEVAFDLLKGIAILEVMFHHSLSYSMRKFAAKWDAAWWAMAGSVSVIHVGVATFLFVAAILLAKSVASRPQANWKTYFSRRAVRAAWPYVLWTAVFLVARYLFIRNGPDIWLTTVEVFGWSVQVPAIFRPENLLRALMWGKAYFHLYFLAILLQFIVVFPLLYLAVRKTWLGFGATLAGACALQAGVLMAQSQWRFLPYPASSAVWYLVPLLGGIWIGMRWHEWSDVWRSWKWPMAAVVGISLPIHVWVNNLVYAEQPRSNFLFNASFVVYTFAASFLLLGWCRTISVQGKVARFTALVGDRSLAFYLIHPIVLYLIAGPRLTAMYSTLPLPVLWVWLTVVGASYGAIEALYRLKLSGFLFGRA